VKSYRDYDDIVADIGGGRRLLSNPGTSSGMTLIDETSLGSV
jgi:hypothetical protein